MKRILTTLLMAGVTGMTQAAMVVERVDYEIDGEAYQGMLVYDDAVSERRPGILMVPNWMGVTENAAKKAYRAGGSEYVVFVADMYGKDIRPQNTDEAGKAAGFVRSDRALMRQRANAALEVFKGKADEVGLDAERLAAIGFCFGGGTVLELARSGASIGAVVSFHGNLDTPNVADAKAIKAPVLVLHGADDPYVPTEQVLAFEAEMREAGVDWQLVSYGGAVHSFTDPTANVPGQAQYHEKVAARAFNAMHQFFAEALGN
ncbi:dienelactone hydrolase [Pseudomonas sp. WN033]|nr:dienelactone hydrolase [Pseudomonas sp. WN033]